MKIMNVIGELKEQRALSMLLSQAESPSKVGFSNNRWTFSSLVLAGYLV
jgi:hypothetical protein